MSKGRAGRVRGKLETKGQAAQLVWTSGASGTNINSRKDAGSTHTEGVPVLIYQRAMSVEGVGSLVTRKAILPATERLPDGAKLRLGDGREYGVTNSIQHYENGVVVVQEVTLV